MEISANIAEKMKKITANTVYIIFLVLGSKLFITMDIKLPITDI
jgi:hypothetical protein